MCNHAGFILKLCVCLCQVSHLSQQVAESQAQQDRLLRDKGSLTKQLGDTLNKLTNQEQDHAKVQCLMCADFYHLIKLF